MALIDLRGTAEQKGLKVDWKPDQGVMINGSPVDTQGLINYGNNPEQGYQPNTYYGTKEQIDKILSSYTMQPPTGAMTTPVSGLVGLRDIAEQRGLNVGYDAKQGVTINGIPVSVNGLTNYGQTPPAGYNANTYYGTQEQVEQLLKPYVVPQPSAEVGKAKQSYDEWAQSNYASQYAPEIESKVKEILTRQFNYDPANDAQFQLAAKELTRNVMETMNARGILNSTITQNQVQQGVANMLPEYQQIAQQRFQDEGKVLMSQVDMLLGMDEIGYNRYQDEGKKYAQALDVAMQMDNEQFDRWKVEYTNRYNASKDAINLQVQADNKRRQEIEDAWDRVTELGYVDNAASIILGVEAGTLSKGAREAKEDRINDIIDSERKHQQQLDLIQAQYEKESKLAKEAADLKVTSGSATLGANGKVLLEQIVKGQLSVEEAEARITTALQYGVITEGEAIVIATALGIPIEIVDDTPPSGSNKANAGGTIDRG